MACDRALDVYYVLDASGSMAQSYPGSSSKLAAAKAAIIATNDVIEAWDNGSRVALLSYQGSNSGLGNPPTYLAYTDYWSPPTDDFDFVDGELANIGADGSTPTAHALRFIRDEIESDQTADPSRAPVLILITDGVPTLSYGDTGASSRGYSFVDSDVQAVNVSDGSGGFHSIATVRAAGQSYAALGLYAGEPLADVMEAVQQLLADIPALTIHSIAVQVEGGIFNDDILLYAASEGGGEYAAPDNLTDLLTALAAAVAVSGCPEEMITVETQVWINHDEGSELARSGLACTLYDAADVVEELGRVPRKGDMVTGLVAAATGTTGSPGGFAGRVRFSVAAGNYWMKVVYGTTTYWQHVHVPA